MENGYLLDTNVISVALRPSDSRYAAVIRHLASKSGYALIPALAVAEIEFGLACAPRPLSPDAASQHAKIRKFFAKFQLLPFDEHTIEPYSLIRGADMERLGHPREGKVQRKAP